MTNYNKEYFKDNEWYDIHGKKTVGIKRFLKHINADDFKNLLVRDYDRDPNSSYSAMVTNSCRIGVAYIIEQLMNNNKKLVYEISIATGIVNNTWHCWIETYDYYIDLTFSQFNDTCPDLTIIKKTKSKKEQLLVPIKTYTIREWIEHEECN